ncbi:MAG: flagellar basal body-associated FliL family protein [Planctomycetota bacterium]|jgi:flagellar basal body-associated protein FliL
MADADDVEQQEGAYDTEQQKDSKTEKSDKPVSSGGTLPWIIMAVVAVLCAGAGFVAGRFFAGFRTPKTAEYSQENEPDPLKNLKADRSATSSQKVWYYDVEPVVANLNVTGVTRYVRAAITLEISTEMDKQKYTAFLDEEKKPVLTNWLTIYLASLTLDDIRGDRNLRRIQSEILDSFNERLFPDAKPQIKHILFKEFAIQ